MSEPSAQDRRRLVRLLEDYAAASEARAPAHRHLPVLGAADAAAIAGLVHDEVTAGEAARAGAAEEMGHPVACRPGCNDCCANVIVVYEPEALRVAAWLAEPAHADAAAWFREAYPRWRAAVGEDAARLERLHAAGSIQQAEALYREIQSRHVMCAFNRDGACTIHPVRPNVCRHAHALDTPDRCRPASPERPRALEYPPLDSYVDKSLAVFRSIHLRRGGQPSAKALCDSVQALLATPPDPGPPATPGPPGRNDPCPCGSGKKHKRCCGA